jgi:colanic acid/amylovoran biosynthesis protein
MKIVITNTTMVNGGDAAIVFSMIDLLRRTFGAETMISIVDTLALVTRRHYPELDVRQAIGVRQMAADGRLSRLLSRVSGRLRRMRVEATLALLARGINLSRYLLGAEDYAAFRRYAEAEMVISVGGTYLVDHYDVTPRLLELDVALAHGKPPLFFTQSLGPFQKSGMRSRISRYFSKSPLILLRDERSRHCLDAMGIAEGKLHVLADAVFGIADPNMLRMAGARHHPVRRVAISVRNWAHFRGQETPAAMASYIKGIAQAVERLIIEHGCEVTFISTCQGIEEYQNKDSLIAEEVVIAMSPDVPRDRVSVDSNFHNPMDLMALLGTYDLVIATRMHMAILALCAGVPVLPIAYEFKTEELFRRLGRGDWVVPIEDVAPGAFADHVDAVLAALPSCRAGLFAAVQIEHERALKAGPLLKTAFRHGVTCEKAKA